MKMLQGPKLGQPTFGGMKRVVARPAGEGEMQRGLFAAPAGQMGREGPLNYDLDPATYFPTHSIVYRDERGATRTARAQVKTTSPTFSMGRKVPGQVLYYRVQRPDGTLFLVRPDRIIAATAFDYGLAPLSSSSQPTAAFNFRYSGDAAAPAGQLRPGDTILTAAQTEEASRAKSALTQTTLPDGTPNPIKGATQGMSDESIGRLLTGIGTAIGATMSTVTAAIQAGSAERIAEIQSATQRYIADRQADARAGSTQAPVDINNAVQLNNALEELRVERLRNNQGVRVGMSTNMMLLVGLGVVAAGAGVYMLTRKGARNNPFNNPVIIKGARRLFVSKKHLDKWLDDGFRVVKPRRGSRS